MSKNAPKFQIIDRAIRAVTIKLPVNEWDEYLHYHGGVKVDTDILWECDHTTHYTTKGAQRCARKELLRRLESGRR